MSFADALVTQVPKRISRKFKELQNLHNQNQKETK